MSLVRPRPHDIRDLPHEGLDQEPRLGLRPGLTGLWQVNARSDPNLESRVRFDLLYVNHWPLLLDVKILAKTVPVVVLGGGGTVNAGRPTPCAAVAMLSDGHRGNGTNGAIITQDHRSEAFGQLATAPNPNE